jgi:histone deacetylase 11
MYLLLLGLSFVAERPASPSLDLAQSHDGKLPLVYSENYNIEFFGLEKRHPFDSVKYRRVVDMLVRKRALSRNDFIEAAKPPDELLHLAHDEGYLRSLNSSWTMARIAELPFLRFFPGRLTRQLIVEPMLYQAGGSLLAALAALRHGWAINVGGGFHHASYAHGEGFCAIADISLVVKYLLREGLVQKIMIVDFDAHQGNGHETDFMDDPAVYILDVYNKDVYPKDGAAKPGIDYKVELGAFTSDREYLRQVHDAVEHALAEFRPDLIIYNAGTDVLAGDPLGALNISSAGIVARDELVFKKALDLKIPVVMLLSGGYQKSNAEVITDSIMNLKLKFRLF